MLNEDHYSCKCGYEISVLDVLNKLVKLESRYISSTKEIMCGECGSKYEKSIQIEELKCPKCSQLMEEVRIEDSDDEICEGVPGKVFNIKGAPYSKPLHSDALGVQPDQVAEHREKFPNIELDSQNRPVFHNAPEHQAYMDKCGIVKHKQKVKSKGKTIATLKTGGS